MYRWLSKSSVKIIGNLHKFRFLFLSDPIELKNKIFFFGTIIDIVKLLPSYSFKFLPKKFHLLLGKIYYINDRFNDSETSFNKSLDSVLTAKATIFFQASTYFSSDQNKLLNYQEQFLTNYHLTKGNSLAYLNWAFWNVGFGQFTEFLKNYLNHLTIYSYNQNSMEHRNLPYHTTHLGHIGLLHKYIVFYKSIDPDRKLIIWPDSCPNRYFLKKVIENSSLKIICKSGAPQISNLEVSTVDTLLYSRKADDAWRVELSSAGFSGSDFPELKDPQSNCLFLEEKEINIGLDLANKLGLDPTKWFVILHIREPSLHSNFPKQNRDSSIIKFREFCLQVQNMGGQVVRMGDTRFPKLPTNFPAIDYAYSEFNSDFFDCWLWSQCRWWTGNQNGASVAALSFGKPRLLTDVWFWDTNTHSFDMWMPKLAYDQRLERYLTVKETFQHQLSRNQDINIMNQNGIVLRDNSNKELQKAAEEMYLQTQYNLNTVSTSDEVSYFNSVFSNYAKIPDTSPSAGISSYFFHQWKNHLVPLGLQ